MTKARFFHAGCAVCVHAENQIVDALDKERFAVEVIHLGNQSGRIEEAERLGVKSVPALVLGEEVLHLNFGAALSDLK